MTDETKRDHQQSPSEAPSQSEKAEMESGEAPKEDHEALLARKDEEIKQMQDRVLRMAAEMENTRKRLERERTEGICFANESLIHQILPVVDNLERAVQHGESEANVQDLLEGVRMTLKGFIDTLTRFGCSPFESVGKGFDPNYHEAVMQEENAQYPENTVIREFQKGYTLNERLLRPAMVVVSKAPATPPPGEGPKEPSGSSDNEGKDRASSENKPKKIKIPINAD